jgi:hypothetical protein
MKKLFILFVIIAITASTAISQMNIKVKDSYGYSASGSLSEATIIVKPQGLYTQYSAILTFTSWPSTMSSSADTLELICTFSLDPKSCMTDMWLYKEDGSRVKANIVDKWSSQIVYNDSAKSNIVQAMLQKKSNGNYELKSTKLIGNSYRKIQFDYFLPVKYDKVNAETAIPSNWFQYQYLDTVKVIYLPNKSFTIPFIANDKSIEFEESYDSKLGNYFVANIPRNKLVSYPALTVACSIGTTGFCSTQTLDNESYYQLSLPAENLKTNPDPMRLCVIIDYMNDRSTVNGETILKAFATSLKKNLIKGDSFNIIISAFKPILVSDNWIPVELIDSVIKTVDFTKLSTISHLFEDMDAALEFINSHGDTASIYMLSNSDMYGDRDIANNFIANIYEKRKTNIPISVFSYLNKNWTTYKSAGMSYTGNDYLYSNLVRMTRGQVFSKIYDNPDPVKGFDAALPKIFGSMKLLSIYSTARNGYTYDKYVLSPANLSGANYVEVGKFSGILPFTVDFQFEFRNSIFNYHYLFNESNIDSNNYRNNVVWACNYILGLESSDANYNNIYGIIDKSIKNRVLSVYTAFYTRMDLSSDPEDPDDPPTKISDANDISGASLSISPNPLVKESTIRISIPDYLKQKACNLTMYDLSGNIVSQFDSKSISSNASVTILWDGTDSNGRALPNGIYILVLKIGDRALSIKVVIAR